MNYIFVYESRFFSRYTKHNDDNKKTTWEYGRDIVKYYFGAKELLTKEEKLFKKKITIL